MSGIRRIQHVEDAKDQVLAGGTICRHRVKMIRMTSTAEDGELEPIMREDSPEEG